MIKRSYVVLVRQLRKVRNTVWISRPSQSKEKSNVSVIGLETTILEQPHDRVVTTSRRRLERVAVKASLRIGVGVVLQEQPYYPIMTTSRCGLERAAAVSSLHMDIRVPLQEKPHDHFVTMIRRRLERAVVDSSPRIYVRVLL